MKAQRHGAVSSVFNSDSLSENEQELAINGSEREDDLLHLLPELSLSPDRPLSEISSPSAWIPVLIRKRRLTWFFSLSSQSESPSPPFKIPPFNFERESSFFAKRVSLKRYRQAADPRMARMTKSVVVTMTIDLRGIDFDDDVEGKKEVEDVKLMIAMGCRTRSYVALYILLLHPILRVSSLSSLDNSEESKDFLLIYLGSFWEKQWVGQAKRPFSFFLLILFYSLNRHRIDSRSASIPSPSL